MKLLLTSAGITNKEIESALFDLAGKNENNLKVVFVTTASNIDAGDKRWLVKDINAFVDLGFAEVDVIDIASLPIEIIEERLSVADILVFGGGNEQYLARVMFEKGLDKILPKIFESRVYFGISAGSMVLCSEVSKEMLEIIYPEEPVPEKLQKTFNFVSLNFLPHLNSQYFAQMRKENIEKISPKSGIPIYALDDNCALKVVDGTLEVIGGGEYIVR